VGQEGEDLVADEERVGPGREPFGRTHPTQEPRGPLSLRVPLSPALASALRFRGPMRQVALVDVLCGAGFTKARECDRGLPYRATRTEVCR
jgi:hypothetical protein